MRAQCTSIPTPDSFAPSALRFLDCQAQMIGAEGYAALASPGSPASALLIGMTTLLIAFFGYRMLLGHVPTIRESVLTIVKIGLVMVLATSWPAYQILIYDVILRSPAEFAAAIGSSTNLPGSGGGLVERIDGVDQALKILAIKGVGSPPLEASGLYSVPSVAPPPFLGFDSFATGFARVIFLVSTVTSFAIIRIGAGLLLALAPLFSVFLLFDGTRGIFEGWIKALISTALASLAIAITLGVTLAFLEPWLATLLARRASGLDIIGAPAQLLAATTIFALALTVVAALIAKIIHSFRIPPWIGAFDNQHRNETSATTAHGTLLARSEAKLGQTRSRAASVSYALAERDRRESHATTIATGTPAGRRANIVDRPARHEHLITATQSSPSRRRAKQRLSSYTSTRDQRT